MKPDSARTALYIRCARFLCDGEHFDAMMAGKLKVQVRTAKRWRKGQTLIPRGVWEDISVLIDAKAPHVSQERDALDSFLKAAAPPPVL